MAPTPSLWHRAREYVTRKRARRASAYVPPRARAARDVHVDAKSSMRVRMGRALRNYMRHARRARAFVRAKLGAGERAVMKSLGFACGWIAAYAPSAACACTAGAYFGSACACGGVFLGALYDVARATTPHMRDVTIGLALSVLPATLSATSMLSPWKAKVVATLDAAVTSALPSDAGTYDAISLVNVTIDDFKFEYMGELNATLPSEDDKYMYNAGAEASGTYCAVPVTYGGWTKFDVVPFWYVCDNNWQGHRSCATAYANGYDDDFEWYGFKALRDCLRAPIEALEANPNAELHFLHLDFTPSYEKKYHLSEGAVEQASALYEVAIDEHVPRMFLSPYQEPCCDALAHADDLLLLLVTLLSVLPLIFLVLSDLRMMAEKSEAKRAFYTRAELLNAKSRVKH